MLGSYTTNQLVPMLELAGLQMGIGITSYECPFGQYRQEILDPNSGLHRFSPDIVVLATHAGETALPPMSDDPAAAVEGELRRWTGLWSALAERSQARLVQHNFALPPEAPMGHLGARLPGSRYRMLLAVNAALGEAAGDRVSVVDCDRVASWFGKRRWFDDKYWALAKQAVSLEAIPVLARHTAAVMAADLGLSRKCLVLDLDNTLWGGVIGEDGLAGIALGAGPLGEAFVAFQGLIRQLKDKGVILAVCSKNNEADARLPFQEHPDMVLRLEDIACFMANWNPKPENLRAIARVLNIGLDSLVFVDDNPAEREVVRQLVPEVDVLTLPADPMHYARALGDCLSFETSSFTAEDAERTRQYQAQARIAELESAATSLEEFHRSLHMQALVTPFDELHLPRIVQLIGKTNQFNLTTRRHSLSTVRKFMEDERCVHLALKLRDRFTDHGLVSVLIAFKKGDALEIDTWLMSCRVIGRTVEAELLSHLCRHAQRLHCQRLRGTYIPTAKNAMVRDVFERFGFQLVSETQEATVWEYDLANAGLIENGFIEPWEDLHDAA